MLFNRLEDEVFNDKADDDDGQKACEHGRNIKQVTIFENEPAKTALPRRYAEDEFGGNQRAPGKCPANTDNAAMPPLSFNMISSLNGGASPLFKFSSLENKIIKALKHQCINRHFMLPLTGNEMDGLFYE